MPNHVRSTFHHAPRKTNAVACIGRDEFRSTLLHPLLLRCLASSQVRAATEFPHVSNSQVPGWSFPSRFRIPKPQLFHQLPITHTLRNGIFFVTTATGNMAPLQTVPAISAASSTSRDTEIPCTHSRTVALETLLQPKQRLRTRERDDAASERKPIRNQFSNSRGRRYVAEIGVDSNFNRELRKYVVRDDEKVHATLGLSPQSSSQRDW